MQSHQFDGLHEPPTFLVVGSGSAGMRHLAALNELYPSSTVGLVRRADSTTQFNSADWPRVRVAASIDDVNLRSLRLAVVASAATLHREHAEQLLRGRVDVLVEKPLAASLDDAFAMVASAEAEQRHLMVGYHLRWSHPVSQFHALVADGAAGQPRSFSFRVGQHLSQWRPGTNPRNSVTARQNLGGGVLLELSHEIDAVQWILGEVHTVSCRLSYDGAPTDGRVETEADLDLVLASGVKGDIHLDMTSEKAVRHWVVHGTDATVSLNVLTGEILRQTTDEAIHQLRKPMGADRHGAERRLLAHSIAVAAGEAQPRCSGAEGVAVLEVIEAARRSAATLETVSLQLQKTRHNN